MRGAAALALLLAPALAQAQHHDEHTAQPLDVVHLQAQATREVDNDQFVAVLAAEAQALNPADAAEDALVARAIEAFHARAEIVRQAMKASSCRVRELNIGSSGSPIRPSAMAARAAAAEVALEPGQSQVTVSASGSIQLER